MLNEVTIWTDGGGYPEKEQAFVSCIIIGDGKYITRIVEEVPYSIASDKIELMAIVRAFKFLQFNRIWFKHVRVNTDSLYVVNQYKKLKEYTYNKEAITAILERQVKVLHKKLWLTLLKTNSFIEKVDIEYTPGHRLGITPNNLCDNLILLLGGGYYEGCNETNPKSIPCIKRPRHSRST